MKLKDAIDYITADYNAYLQKEAVKAKSPDKTEEEEIEFQKLFRPIVLILSIGAGSLSGFSHLQDLLYGAYISMEFSGSDDVVSSRKLHLIPDSIQIGMELQKHPVFTKNGTPSSGAVLNAVGLTYKTYWENLLSIYDPKYYILAIDPEFANPKMIGHPEASPIHYTAAQLNLTVDTTNPFVAKGEYNFRNVVCCYIEESISSDYSKPISNATNEALVKKAKDFYKRVRAEKTFAFSEECVPKEGFLLNQLVPFLTDTVMPNKGFLIVDNKAHWHINGAYHDNYFFETMCEIPYMFMHPPFDTYQDYIYWWYPYHLVGSKSYRRDPPLYSIDELAHFTDGIVKEMQKGGKRRKTLRKWRGTRRRRRTVNRRNR